MIPTPSRALVRKLPQSYAVLYSQPGHRVSLDFANQQHHAYVEALRTAGLEVTMVEADNNRPDCVFIEDTAVVWNGSALITRMTSHREGEQPAVEAALEPTHAITRLEAPASLEGGDVLHVENVTYVGLTRRTNETGADALEKFLAPFGRQVVPVRVENCLHLKSAATYLGDGALVLAPSRLGFREFEVEETIETEPGEEYAANCLRIGNYLLIPTGFPKTESKLRRFAENKGVEIIPLDCSELRKGGGSLTCLSLIW